VKHRSSVLSMALAAVPDRAPDDEDIASIVQFTETAFTSMVAALSNSLLFQSEAVNSACRGLWDLVGSRVVEFTVTPGGQLESLHFLGIERANGSYQGAIVAPRCWPKMVVSDPWMQLGATVFMASKARDFWNAKLRDAPIVVERAKAHEAEFLRLAMRDATFSPTEYQLEVLNAFPASIPQALRYDSESFSLERAKRMFVSFSHRQFRDPSPIPAFTGARS
jgi:hypothetical protein